MGAIPAVVPALREGTSYALSIAICGGRDVNRTCGKAAKVWYTVPYRF